MGKEPRQIRSATDHAEHLIRLQINQDSNSQAWTKFFITIQTGLGTAFGILLLYGRFTGIKLLLAFAVAIAGIGTSFVIRKIIERNYQWSAFFIRKYNHLPGNQPERVFPMRDGETDPKTIDEIDPGEIGKLIMRFCEGTIVFWIIAAVAALVIWGSASVPTRS
jgi:hypothetical protein